MTRHVPHFACDLGNIQSCPKNFKECSFDSFCTAVGCREAQSTVEARKQTKKHRDFSDCSRGFCFTSGAVELFTRNETSRALFDAQSRCYIITCLTFVPLQLDGEDNGEVLQTLQFPTPRGTRRSFTVVRSCRQDLPARVRS